MSFLSSLSITYNAAGDSINRYKMAASITHPTHIPVNPSSHPVVKLLKAINQVINNYLKLLTWYDLSSPKGYAKRFSPFPL